MHPEDRVRILLRDLGRPTRRGVRKCHKCGTVTGTRGRSCKNPACDVVFKEGGYQKKSITDEGACRITLQSQHCRVYSVRSYHRGPDYRTFVQLPLQESNICISSATSQSNKSLSFGSRCYLEACNGNKAFPCSHIKAAEECRRDSERIFVKESVISTISVPNETKQVLSGLVCQMPDLLVQRCSSQTFVVNCGMTSRYPFGCCHMLFLKVNKDDGINEQRFLCSCQPVKLIRRSHNGFGDASADCTNKYCLHYFACVYAFASDEELSVEFGCFLSQAFEVYPGNLRSATVETTGNDSTSQEEESPEQHSQISVEIMRENLCLLESIAAVDDSSPEIQTTQCSLSEHTPITNTEDALSFGESSTLDSLDEDDPNCATHLTHISEILDSSTQNSQDCQMMNSTTALSGTESERNAKSQPKQYKGTFSQNSSSRSKRTKSNVSSTYIRRKRTNVVLKGTNYPQRQQHPVDLGEGSRCVIDQASLFTNASEPEGVSNTLQKLILRGQFEAWLAGLNGRLNAVMNYQLQEACSVVEYVSHEIFQFLKERIIDVCKRKSHGVLITRTDKSPVGSFRKFTWKITSIIQLLGIFESSQLPLKLHQFFVQTPGGMFKEWIPPKDEKKSRRKQILPVLHCTKIKIGKLDSKDWEMTPFLIEWIPHILPGTSVGELSINFFVTHAGPIQTEEERKACIAPIQRIIQQSQTSSNA